MKSKFILNELRKSHQDSCPDCGCIKRTFINKINSDERWGRKYILVQCDKCNKQYTVEN